MNPQSPIRTTERITRSIGSIPSLVLHTVLFILSFTAVVLGWLDLNTMLLVLTTVVSLEAIYLAIFIQMSVNENTRSLREVEEDIDEIQEDVEEMSEDIEEISEDAEEDEERDKQQAVTLEKLTANVQEILADLEALKKK